MQYVSMDFEVNDDLDTVTPEEALQAVKEYLARYTTVVPGEEIEIRRSPTNDIPNVTVQVTMIMQRAGIIPAPLPEG